MHADLYFFFYRVLGFAFAALANKHPFYSLKVSTGFSSPHSPHLRIILDSNKDDHFKRMSYFMIAGQHVLHENRRVQRVCSRITGQNGLQALSWASGLTLHFPLLSCFYTNRSALSFPDDFIEKQWQIMTRVFY